MKDRYNTIEYDWVSCILFCSIFYSMVYCKCEYMALLPFYMFSFQMYMYSQTEHYFSSFTLKKGNAQNVSFHKDDTLASSVFNKL